MDLLFRKLNEKAIVPKYQTVGSAGLDLHCILSVNEEEIRPYETVRINTGLSVEIPEGYVGLIFIRSSVGSKKNLVLANQVGVIDSDYRGEILLMIHNRGSKAQMIENGERLAQLVITPIVQPKVVEVFKLSDTIRGTGGFGSTGK